jgi:hypothetical protein
MILCSIHWFSRRETVSKYFLCFQDRSQDTWCARVKAANSCGPTQITSGVTFELMQGPQLSDEYGSCPRDVYVRAGDGETDCL